MRKAVSKTIAAFAQQIRTMREKLAACAEPYRHRAMARALLEGTPLPRLGLRGGNYAAR